MITKSLKRTLASVFALLILGLLTFYLICTENKSYKYETVWGEVVYFDEELTSLLNTNVMERLKGVDQSGPSRYFGPRIPKFSRFDHSLGVLALVQKFSKSKSEMIAALLHDASHTVFSHVADYLFDKNREKGRYVQASYQDSIHMKYLDQPEIHNLISKIGIKFEDVAPDKKEYLVLEQECPDMCADRIEYNLHTAVLFELMTKEEAKEIVKDLRFENGRWFFTTVKSALRLSEVSLYFTQNFWGSKWNLSMNVHFAAVLKQALADKIISYQDLYRTDPIVMKKVLQSPNDKIRLFLKQCENSLAQLDHQEYVTMFHKPKFRGLDPWVLDKASGKLRRLSSIDTLFKTHYENVKGWCEKGYEIQVLKGAL